MRAYLARCACEGGGGGKGGREGRSSSRTCFLWSGAGSLGLPSSADTSLSQSGSSTHQVFQTSPKSDEREPLVTGELSIRHFKVVIIHTFDERVPKQKNDTTSRCSSRSKPIFSKRIQNRILFSIGVNSYLSRCVSVPLTPRLLHESICITKKKKNSPYGPYLLALFHYFAAVRNFTHRFVPTRDLSFPTRVLPALVSFGAEQIYSIQARASTLPRQVRCP